ncbi:RNA polymerase II, Rpb4, core protein [Medicago truncatula]|uniref:RNA polymerase II, Rpb4, core protein n=1 Tax=Medicago truncatula TaxID=3880 RepID=A0A072UK05_MEDTR|nr:RNA polymerase II, Rpb4, core protein [Medicago truncatula]
MFYLLLEMKILEENAGALTNFEVLDFLRAKGASKDPSRVLAKVAMSEYKVYDYLVKTPAGSQTRESVKEYFTVIKQHDLSEAEIIEDCEERFPDEEVTEIVEKVGNTLPAPPDKATPEEITKGDEETETQKHDEISYDQTEDGEQMDTS